MIGFVDKKEIKGVLDTICPAFSPLIVCSVILTAIACAAGLSGILTLAQGPIGVLAIVGISLLTIFMVVAVVMDLLIILSRKFKRDRVNLMTVDGDPLHPRFIFYDIPEDLQLKRNLINFNLRKLISDVNNIVSVKRDSLFSNLFISIRPERRRLVELLCNNDIQIKWRPFDQEWMMKTMKREIINILIDDQLHDLTDEQRTKLSEI